MSNIIIVGAQWGDEGKGKVIDIFAKDADYIVRYQGGNNAGHTVVIGNDSFILHLIPSGILHKGKVCVIGNGVVVDPKALLDEMAQLAGQGIKVTHKNLLISDQAHVIMPYHRVLDKLREAKRGTLKIGTTGRGIGPCYADKVARCGIRFADILNKNLLKQKLAANLKEKNDIFRKAYNYKPFSFNEVYKEYIGYAGKLKGHIANTTVVLNDALKNKKSILFEGAQGTLLDIDQGTYPFVTSSNATAGGACTGSGVGPNKIDRIIGIVKAYTTRVGEGPFPTEFGPELMHAIRQKGKEFGATTGRPRRCGWFDSVIVKHAVRVNGIDDIAIMKLDVLDDLKSIEICVGYKYKGKIYKDFPADLEVLSKCAPIYETHKGWSADTTNVTKFADLPKEAKSYLKRLSGLLDVKISLVSVGSKREQAFRLS